MRGAAALILVSLGAVLVADFSAAPLALAQSSSGSEIVVAQNDRPRTPGFLRFLFGNRRQRAQPPPEFPGLQIFPGLEPPAASRRDRRTRTAEPTPQVAAVEKSPTAKRALVIGDFMAGALAKGLTQAYAEDPNVVVIDANSGSSGLVREDYYDWPVKVAELVGEQKPDAILIIIGANDRQVIRTDAGSEAFGSDEWRVTYAARVAALADAVKATGKPVLWGGLVPVSSGAMSSDYSAINGVVREQIEAKGLRYVDMWNGFADEEGKYVSVGPDVKGQVAQLRAADGLNFTRAGQRKLAFFVEGELSGIFGGASPALASVDTRPAAAEGGVGPAIGPMVSLDALSLAGGDALSGGIAGAAPDSVAATIASRLSSDDGVRPPAARADSFLWPALRKGARQPVGTDARGPNER